MKVALVVETFDPFAGGLEQWTVSLARCLVERGHDVHVVTFANRTEDLAATVHVLPPRRGIAARASLVAAATGRIGAAVVHDTGTGWSGDVFHPQTGSRLLAQARLVATQSAARRCRAAVSPVSIRWRWQMARLERRQMSCARRVIAVSRLVRAQLCARYGLAEAGIAVIANGVDTARFAALRLAPLRNAARQALGAGDATLYLASAHNMHLKGVDVAMRALARLVAEGADARLMVAGTAPDAFWPRLAADLRLGDRVRFLGPVADMHPLFAAADALVHPTRWDACSLSTIEAGAAGLPVVTTAANGAAELIADGTTGFVLPDPEDAGLLAERMRALLDPALRARMGQAARDAARRHDIADNLRAVEAVLSDLAGQPVVP